MAKKKSAGEFVDPKVDIAFKKIFGDEKKTHILISFLNAVMKKDIIKVTVLNPYQVPKLKELKYTILDIKAEDSKGDEYIIEMQANPYVWFDKRALDYLSRAYVNQLDLGDDYSLHKPVYFIGVLDFNYFNSKKYLTKHFIVNLETSEQEIKDFEFYFIELKKFKKQLSELKNVLDKWIFFLKELHEMNALPRELSEIPEISEAAETAKQSLWTKEEMEVYYKIRREEAREINLIQELKKAKNQLEENEKQLEKNEKQLEENEKQLEEKDEILRTQENDLKKAIQALQKSGSTLETIAQILNKEVAEISRLLEA